MLWITGSGTGSGLKRRIERRVRRKLCRSTAVDVKVSWSDAEDDASLSWRNGVGFPLVLEGEGVDMLICTFSGMACDFTANAEIAIRILGVLNGHRDLRA